MGCWPGCALCLLIKDELDLLVISSGPWESLCEAELCRAQDMLAASPLGSLDIPKCRDSVLSGGWRSCWHCSGPVLVCSPKHFPHVGQEPVKMKDVLHIFWRGLDVLVRPGCQGPCLYPCPHHECGASLHLQGQSQRHRSGSTCQWKVKV